ncbi:hypothetical protein DXB77_03820 [Clostridium sp. OM05-9]|uniref:hypothetical protein n=1 Tax=Clostridium sp. OM05-9 TaxID=2293045 RepID=UPI000E513D74|nr:hypothetical protein [Clostridium sp. OM05-9]RHV12747.1 hypothetical protein DXB77_03820 [Clostridium sp. OM05-9]
MGTGISMSSVNKIKELAESRDYSLALDILEHQDLTKSLSPQFIKICGEVYYENGRYQEARAALVKAHSMAPVGNKIIYSLIRVYLSMGFYSLANTYYEIYKFNQNEKDAGTYRIEYMLAKAERKPYKELYGILISANEKETSDIWDFEMLLLYKAMGNEEKFQSEAEMFCATYKGSSYIDKVNQLREKLYDVDKAIYCYPETEAMDDDIAQQDVRLMEEKVLEADDLRIHPKDPKITLMVEDREPVTNSMKFKQMLLKSKEKKESKKLQKQGKKAEQQKEQTDQEVLDTPENSDQEENTGKKKWFLKNRMSKKEEEAIEEAFAEQENSEVDRDQLLGEIVNPESDETVAENGMEAEAEPVADPTGDEKKPRSLDELSEDSFEDGVDDFDFDNEEYDSVLMVDVDDAIMPEPSNEHTEEILEEAPEEIISEDITDASDVEKPENVESEEPEKSETDEQQIEKKSEYTESVEDHEITEAETKDAKEPETSESNEEDADSAETPGPAGEDDDSVVIEEVEETEKSELEETAETAEPAEDAEKAEMLEENQELELESTDTMEKTTSDDPFDIDIAIQSLDEYTFDADTWKDDSFEQAYEDDDIVEIEAATGSDTKVEAETENEAEEEVEIEPEVEVRADSDPGSELEVEAEADSEKESESKTEAEKDVEIDSEAVVEMNLEAEVNPESETEQEPEYEIESEKTAHRRDFPIFRSSLFPDYNSDKPPVVELMKETVDMKAEYDRKMSDNLEKEEQLINQADELLARLGIELGTKYASNTDYFNMHSDSFVNLIEDETDVEKADLSSDEKGISEQEDNRKEQLEHLDKKQEKKYKLKRNDK